jgi:hypothetical protein
LRHAVTQQSACAHPNNLLVDVFSQVLATKHSRTRAGSMAHNAAYNHTQHIRLGSQPAYNKSIGV